jgi:hypothetical protein
MYLLSLSPQSAEVVVDKLTNGQHRMIRWNRTLEYGMIFLLWSIKQIPIQTEVSKFYGAIKTGFFVTCAFCFQEIPIVHIIWVLKMSSVGDDFSWVNLCF